MKGRNLQTIKISNPLISTFGKGGIEGVNGFFVSVFPFLRVRGGKGEL